MRPALVSLLVVTVTACGGAPPPAPAPAPVASAAPARPPPCAADTPRQPANARARMSTLGDEVRRCFLLGGTTDQTVTLKAELVVSDDGKVKKSSLSGAPASRKGSNDCATKAVAAATFSPFCGDDVALSWTFAIQ